jgi:hypothetical protein
MAKAAKRKTAKKPAAKTVARRKPTLKPKPRRKPMTDKEAADKNAAAEKAAAAKRDERDRQHEARIAPEPLAGGAKGAYSETTSMVPPADMLTEQEKDTASEVPGVGPASASEVSPGPVETIEDLGIGPREPYPTGGAPAADAAAKKKVPNK